MGMILLSFLGILMCAAVGLASLSYAYHYRRNQAAQQQAAHASQISNSDQPSFSIFRSQNIGDRASGAIQLATNTYEKTVMRIKDTEYSDSFGKYWHYVTDFFLNFSSRVRQLIDYLVSLSKPIADEVTVETKKDQEEAHPAHQVSESVQEGELDKVVEKVTAQNSFKQNIHDEDIIQTSSSVTSGVSDEDKELFEKLESRLLNKLKEHGMGNFDLWLQLGDLYLKHEEKDKAQEVFAMILKSSEGHYKELARDRLIGLG